MISVLVIEDNSDIRENIIEILELAGYITYSAENGQTGVTIAMEQRPNLILCDIMMPMIDGYCVLLTLRNTTETAHIPFIFLTAKAEKVDHEKGLGMGANGYISKPFESADLLNTVESNLTKAAGYL